MFENIPLADLAMGRSTVRQRILALLMSEPSERLHLREIQRRANTSPGTASRELAKLVAAGLIEREAEGAQVYFRASASPFAAMMRSLLIIVPAPAEGSPRPRRLPRPKTNAPTVQRAASTAGAADTVIEAATIDEPPTETAPPRVFRPKEPDAIKSAWSTVPDLTAELPAEQPPIADPIGLEIARRLAESVESLYAESGRLRGIYLYGDRAAGPTRADADVETLIVLDRVDHYGADLERTSHLCAALSHELKLIVSRIFVSESDWLHRTDGSLPAIRAGALEL